MRAPYSLLLAPLTGCTSVGHSRASSSQGGYTGLSGDAIISHAERLSLGWPLEVAGLVALLGGLGFFMFGHRVAGVSLLAIGLLLALAPGWLAEVLSHTVWVAAGCLVVLVVLGTAWVGVRVWRKILLKRSERISQ